MLLLDRRVKEHTVLLSPAQACTSQHTVGGAGQLHSLADVHFPCHAHTPPPRHTTAHHTITATPPTAGSPGSERDAARVPLRIDGSTRPPAELAVLLHAACAGGKLALATSLLKQGADAGARDAEGRTAFFLACSNGAQP